MPIIQPTILDLMEYANDAAMQAAFVTNAAATYGADVLTGGVATADSYFSTYTPDKACDDNYAGSYWWETMAANPHWWKYDLGAGVTKIVNKLVTDSVADPLWFRSFVLRGSNNDADWAEIYIGTITTSPQTFTFANTVAYRYYRLDDIYGYVNDTLIRELEMMERLPFALQSYSESTIKQEGSYALKGVALITTGLNKTLTRTVSPTINLTDKTIIKFDIRASRTGSNIKIGIHDSGGTTTEITPVIAAADTWQTVVWDISAVSNANKDAIDSIIVTIANADAANTFYIDNMFGDTINNYLIHRGRDRFRTTGISLGN